ncbi:MAG: prolipoprotein diacylglyceryl transferase family protein [bacterium]
MRPILFHIGEIAIPSFWAMAFLGFLAALVVVRRQFRERGYDDRMAYDMVLWAYVGGWIGARLFVIPAGWNYFVEDPIAFLLSSSGWVWYGGVVGGAVAVLAWASHVGVPWLTVGDIAAPGLALGLALGRVGCQLAGDGDYGVPTDLPWGMSYPDGVVPTTDRVHPAPVYELIGYLIIFAGLWMQRRRLAPGHLLGHYLVWSGLVRLLVEFLRRNPAWLLGLTTAQAFSGASIGLGVWLLRRQTDRSAAPRIHTDVGAASPAAAADPAPP